MSFQASITFKDSEITVLSEAAKKQGKEIKDFIKDVAIERAKEITGRK